MNGGTFLPYSRFKPIAIHHGGISLTCHAQETVECIQAQSHGCGLQAQQHVICLCVFFDGQDGFRRRQVFYYQVTAIMRCYMFFGKLLRHHQVNMMYGLVLSKHVQLFFNDMKILARQETINLLSHIWISLSRFILFAKIQKISILRKLGWHICVNLVKMLFFYDDYS